MANVNVVPSVLQNYEIYDETDGSERLLGTSDVELPELEFLSADLKGAGIAGEVSVPVVGHTNNLTVTFNWRTIQKNFTKLSAPGSHIVTCRGALQNYDAATGLMQVSAVKVTMRSLPSKASIGKLEPGEVTESGNELSINYLKMTVDGEELLEIDKLNYVYRVNGVDYLADTRDALGQ